jgi:hypothetical protein
MNIGRNEPCPCGSGKKYKNCCPGQPAGTTGTDEVRDALADLKNDLQGREFASLEEVQVAADAHLRRRNSVQLAEFHGLSPEQMHRFLCFPFESPTLARFNVDIPQSSNAPVLALFSLLADAIGDTGLKATAKGNLPQSFCREAAHTFWGEEKYAERLRFGSIRTETDFFDMHCMRLLAGLAGLIRKVKGSFLLTAKCRKKVAARGVEAVYPDLFVASVKKFNWAYHDGFQEIFFLQRSFLFSLFLLSRYGGTSRPQSFYEDNFLAAFPRLLDEIQDVSYQTVEETARKAYFYRVFDHFAAFFGLVGLQAVTEERSSKTYTITKLPLLDHFISFTP